MKFINKVVHAAALYYAACAFSVCAQVFPSDYVSRIWTAADGLPGNAATDIIQSSDGYIYIGTYDGLVKFDGFDFTTLNKNSGSDYSFVSARSVLEDSRHNLWVGANDEGVAELTHSGTIKVYTTNSGLPNNSIRAFAEDHNGNVWIGTAAGIVFVSPDGKVNKPAGLSDYGDENALVVSMYCDTAGRIWAASSKAGGFYYYSDDKFRRYTALDVFGDYYPTAVGQSASGAFWFGLSQNGVVCADNERVEKVKSGTAMDTTSVNDIYLDRNGELWFGTEQGLVLYRDGAYSMYTEADGLTNNNVKRVIEDREGNMWVATDRGGIEKLSMGKFRMENIGTTVNAIAEDKQGRVWIGTDDGLRCYAKDGEPVENSLTQKCSKLRIRHTGVAVNGDILISCYSKPGQLRYDGKTIQSWTSEQGLAGDKTRIGVENSKGDVYVGSTTGLSIIHKDGTVTSYTREQGLSNDYIMCIYEDTDHQMWIGTDGGGINILVNGKVTGQLTASEGLAGNVIFKIMQDKTGVFWICTGTGITRYDRKTSSGAVPSAGSMFNYTSAQGLGSDSVFQMLIDYTNTVWMTSNRGISCAKLSDFTEVMEGRKQQIETKFFNKNDGLRSGGVTSTSLGMCDTYGRLWFTLIDGFAIYDPVKAKSNNILPIVNIESVKIDDRPVADINSEISIPAGTKRIDIKYTGLSFISPERVRFKYELSGFDTKYSEPTQLRTVSYTNLKPGKYTFGVVASNADGTWCREPASLSFIQKPFFYQLWWFWILCAAVTAGAILLGIYMHDRDAKNRQLQLETMVQMKTVDLQIERDKSEHLLRNILPEAIAEKLKEPGAATVADRFEETTVLFSDIVGFTDITSRESPEDVVKALNDLVSRFDERASRSGVEKIKTIGDAYMAACGVPVANQDHAAVMIKFARGMYEDLAAYNAGAKIPFRIRIGLNSGPVIAGVIGKEKFIYDLWGDTVNVASRMESLCKPGEILVTDAVKRRVESSGGTILFTDDGEQNVKGKGQMKTYSVRA